MATLASKVDIPREDVNASIINRTLRATTIELVPIAIMDEKDRRSTFM